VTKKKKKEIGRQIIARTHTNGWLISKQLIYEDKFLRAYKTNSILSVTGKVIYMIREENLLVKIYFFISESITSVSLQLLESK
jgi:hypothetical protein